MWIIQYSMSGSWLIRQKVKCKSFSFMLVKVVATQHFFTAHDMLAGQMFICYCWHMSLSGFYTILPYLVLMFSPSFMCSLTTLVLEHKSSGCFSLLPFTLFVTSCLPCIFLMSSLLLEISLSVYVCRFLQM